MRRLLRTLVLLFLSLSLAAAQTATVTHNVNLRPDPSTDNDPIAHLQAGTQLQLLESDPTNGFFRVQVSDQTGWVWGKRIEIQQDSTVPPSTPSTPSTSPSTSGQDLFAKLMASRKAAVGQPLLENGNDVCGPTGDATDSKRQSLNANKNRIDQPGDADYVEVGWDDLSNLPSDRVDDFQGAPVSVIGFLSHKINVENQGSGESTNCHLLGADEVDWHIYLTKSPAQPIGEAIIVETIPRTRPSHKWRTGLLSPLVDSNTRVRISGWLMFDFEHVGVIGSQRGTVWEVHPVTRIQVENNGQWVDLDGQQ
jgi:SH3 domain-containing protein